MEVFLFYFLFMLMIGLLITWLVLKGKNSIAVSRRNMQLEYRDIKRNVKKQTIVKVLFFIGIIALGIGVLYYAVMLLLMILSAFEILVSFADPYGGTPVIDLVNKMIIMMGYPFMVLIFSVYVFEVRAIIINVKCRKEVKVRLELKIY